MNWESILQFVCIILAGAATAVPLALQLVRYAKMAVEEKNWTKLLELVLELMKNAEEIYESGPQRRDYVIDAVMQLGQRVGYTMEEEALGKLIDDLCAMSKTVNAAKK